MHLGLGDANVVSSITVSPSGGVSWGDWLKAGTDVARALAPLAPENYADQLRKLVGTTTLTPDVAKTPIGAPPATSWGSWLSRNWIPVALAVIGGAVVLGRGRRRR